MNTVQIIITALLLLAVIYQLINFDWNNPKNDLIEAFKQAPGLFRRLLLIGSLLIVFVGYSHAQTRAVKDAQGNYSASHSADTTGSKATGKTFTDSKGKSYPVYESVNGKLYYYRTSRSGNVYKAYIKVDQN